MKRIVVETVTINSGKNTSLELKLNQLLNYYEVEGDAVVSITPATMSHPLGTNRLSVTAYYVALNIDDGSEF